MGEHKPPNETAAIRSEISELLATIPDRETLVFCLWMFKKIANNEELPPPERIKALRDAFIRTMNALRNKKKIRREDLALVLRYTDLGGLDISRPLADTVRHLRE